MTDRFPVMQETAWCDRTSTRSLTQTFVTMTVCDNDDISSS